MYKRIFKRLLDIILCTIAIVLLSPVYLLVAIGILLSSPGPVFYYSKRGGKNSVPFNFYKFRSMHVTNHDKGLFIADPDRVFKFGRFIRRMKLDELPQLLNVIKGDMSIVGPRPMVVKDRLYTGRYEPITRIRPGLTSAASLFDYTIGDAYKDDIAYRKEVLPYKLEMELLYVNRESFSYDCELVCRTIFIIISVLFGKKTFDYQPEYEELKKIGIHSL